MSSAFRYSKKYLDDNYEYRFVTLPVEYANRLPLDRFLTVNEWRKLGVKQCDDWEHFLIHKPERHILVFRRSRQSLTPPSGRRVVPL